jgi:regulator of protease activity HflC (stomatin/prohibitin superfamily)
MKVVYDVAGLADTFISMVETTLRQEVGKLDGDTIVTSREFLSERLRNALQQASSNWGILIIRVEIEDINFDREVTDSLSKARQQELVRRAQLVAAQAAAEQEVLKAEAEKKAEILRAEGLKLAEIAKAEGERQAQILRAQGKFEEEKLKAEGQFLLQSREQEGLAKGYAAVVASLEGNSQVVIALEALKAQAKVAESLGSSSNSLIVPSDTAGLLGAFGATLKALEFSKLSNRSD